MVSKLQRDAYNYLQSVARPVDAAANKYIRKPLNRLMPGKWGDNLAGATNLAAEMSPAGDMMDIKRGGQGMFTGLKQGDPMRFAHGVGDTSMGLIGSVPFAGDAAKLAGLAGMGMMSKADDVWDMNKAERQARRAEVGDTGKIERQAAREANRAESAATDYKMQHAAPNEEYGFNLSGEGIDDFMPDILGPKGKQYYGGGQKGFDEAVDVLKKMNNNPDGTVTIYRSVPSDVDKINDGDWVTTVRSYADDHMAGEDGWHILSKEVPAKEVWGNGDSVMEYGWTPSKKTKDVWGTTKSTTKYDTPEFKNWFGDSKVVDEGGKPLTVYHGTDADITSFDANKIGSRDDGFFGSGFYFTDKKEIAGEYIEDFGDKGKIMDVNISLEHPFVWDTTTKEATARTKQSLEELGFSDVWGKYEFDEFSNLTNKKDIARFTNKLKSDGYDGVMRKGYENEYVVFEPEKIKSVHNEGTYNPKSKNILKSLAPIAAVGGGAAMMANQDQDPWAIPTGKN